MNIAVIQARMGSSRLPGKMMLPLDCEPVITRVIDRVAHAESIDRVVLATTDRTADDILEIYGETAGASVYRGSEEDVLGRMYAAASTYDPDVVVRIAGDRPVVPVAAIDAVVEEVADGVEYASNVLERSFPRGFEVEAFTYDSFATVNEQATDPYEREHVTPYYREHPERFAAVNVTSDAVFEAEQCHDRTDLRLTLDEALDYELLKRVYEGVPFEDILPVTTAIEYVDDHDLTTINADVAQKNWRQQDD